MKSRRPPSIDSHAGFTLIEVLVVMSIVAVLASVAYPLFSRHLQQARLAEARQYLLKGASTQESIYATRHHYTDRLRLLALPEHSDSHRFGVETLDPAQQSYTLTATRHHSHPDAPCHTLSLDQTGRRQAANALGEDTSARCWP